MDKVIKFRAWSTENKKMYPVDEFTCNWNRNFVTKTSELVIKSTNILMQFTGLYDCEGKEVWEGDILEVTSDNDGQKYITSFNCNFIRGLSVNNLRLAQDMGLYEYSIYSINCRVIGNIYEHPNLLENG